MTVSKMLAFIKPKSQISVKKSKRTNQWEKKVDAIVKAKREEKNRRSLYNSWKLKRSNQKLHM